MKFLVNGVETEIAPGSELDVIFMSDRLSVRTKDGAKTALVARHGDKTWVSFDGDVFEIEPMKAAKGTAGGADSGQFFAPMPGMIIDLMVSPGESVTKGQKLLVLEAMKTQQPVIAPFDGVVVSVPVQKSQQVTDGMLLISLEKKAD